MGGFIYLWYDRKHKRFYLGSHWGSINDGYVCSSKWMKQAYARRPKDFKRRIIKKITTSKRDLLIEELRYLQMIKDSEVGSRYYNLARHINNTWFVDNEHKISVIDKIRRAAIKQFSSPEARKKHSEITKASLTEEVREKMSKAKKGKPSGRKGIKFWTPERMKNHKAPKLKGRKYFNNGVEQKMCVPGTEPEGWILGCLNNGWDKRKARS